MLEFTEKQKCLIDMVLKHEGGYVNNVLDKGKETYCGISRVYHPNWNGWAIIDAHKPLKTNQKLDNETLKSFVYDFYLNKFYNPIRVDEIGNLLIAGHLFCHAVNAGLLNAVKIIQKSINKVYNTNIVIDGKIGAITLSWLNNPDKQEALVTEIIAQRKAYYENITKAKPSQTIFLKGWLNRVNGTTAYCSAQSSRQLGFIANSKNDEPVISAELTTDGKMWKIILQLLFKLIMSFFKK